MTDRDSCVNEHEVQSFQSSCSLFNRSVLLACEPDVVFVLSTPVQPTFPPTMNAVKELNALSSKEEPRVFILF